MGYCGNMSLEESAELMSKYEASSGAALSWLADMQRLTQDSVFRSKFDSPYPGLEIILFLFMVEKMHESDF